MAYIAIEDNKQFIIVDGKKEKQYDGIVEGSLIFSPDSKRQAYTAEKGNKSFVVVDGKEMQEYDGIAELRKVCSVGSYVFSNEEIDKAPFVSITPLKIPHKFSSSSYINKS